jgi:hypothetical protein
MECQRYSRHRKTTAENPRNTWSQCLTCKTAHIGCILGGVSRPGMSWIHCDWQIELAAYIMTASRTIHLIIIAT